MSTTIDTKVVEMRFDNRQFENNVSTTMSTLDKLKQKLNLDGASKGLENVSSAAGKVDMSSLSNGVENIRMKFSALEVVGVTALANITNSAVNAGKNLVKSLSVDQITSGWNKYGQKTSSVQTIMNATGKSIDEVNQYLNKLMWFSDETSYGFTDMTAALGQMTSAGGNIDKLIPLITGVANATAFAGKGASEFSRVMYNLNQSYGAGYLQYTDWRSIDLAGVSSKQLKETFIEVGEALGKIEKGSVTAANFATTLKDKWADTEVLEVAFGRFAEMSEKAYEMVQSGEVDTASEAYEILSKQYDGVAITAAKAAQEAKTFSEAIDATKDAVSSGWMKSFEIIFGDYEKAKVLWTDLANTLWDVFAAGAEVRNWVLETAMNFAEPWQAISEKLGNVTKAVDKITDSADKLKYFQEVVSKVWRGEFNNVGDNPDRYDLLKAAGYDHRVVQDLVNKGARYKLTIEDIEASHKKFGLTMETTTEETEDLTAAINNLSEDELRNAGLTEDEIELYKALAKEAERTGKTVSELADEMSKNDGRTMLIDSFKNFGSIILDTIQLIKDALAEVFNIPNASEVVVKLYGMIRTLKEFSESIRLTNKETGELTEAGQRFMSIFKGVFAAIDIVLTIIKGPAKLAFNVLKELLNFFGVNVLDILANVGEALVDFRDNVDGVIDTITKFIVDNITTWIEKFKETEIFKTIAGWFKDASDSMSGAIDKVSGKLSGFNASGVASWFTKVYDFVSGITKALSQNKIVTTVIDGICTAFGKLKSFFSSFKLPEFNLDNVRNFLDTFILLGDNIGASGKTGLAGVLGGLGTTLNTKFVTPKWNTFLTSMESFFGDFVGFWLKIGDKIKKAFGVCQDALKAVVKFIFGTEEVDLPTIMAAVEKFLWIVTLLKAIKLMDTIISPFDNITAALKDFASARKWEAIGDAFKAMAIALGVLTVCIVIIASLPDMNKAWQAAGMIAALLIVMGGIIVGLGILSSKIGGLDIGNIFGIAVSLLLVVGAIALMVKTLKDIDDFKLKDPVKTFGYLAAILLALTVGIKMIAKAGSANFKSIAAILTLVAALKLILDVITAYDEFDWSGKGRAINKMMEMLFAISLAANIASRGAKDGGVKGLAFTILAMVVSLKIIASAIEDYAAMDEAVLEKGGKIVLALLGVITLMGVALSLANKGSVLEKGQKSVNNFTGLATALLAIVASIWLLGKMDTATLEQGGRAVAQVLILLSGMLFALGKSCSGLKIGPIITMIIGFGLLMAEMAILMKHLDGVSWESKVSTASAIGAILLAMAFAIRSISKADVKVSVLFKWVGAMVALAGILFLLTEVLKAVKEVNPLTSIGNAVALAGLLAAMAGVLHILSGLDMRKLSTNKMTKLIGMFAGLTLILYGLTGVLNLVRDVNGPNAISNVIALSGLLAAMSGILYILSGLDMRKLSGNKMIKILGMFAGLTLTLYGLVGVLAAASLIDPDRAIPNVLALSTLLGVLTGVLVVLSKFKVKFNGGAIAAMALLSAILYELVGVLYAMKGIDPVAALPRILALSTLLAAVASTLLILDKFKVGFNGGAVAAIALLSAVLYELVGVLVLAQFIKPEDLLSKVFALSALLAAVAGVLLILDKFNVKFNGGAVAAMSLLALVLGELTGVLILANYIKPEGAITRVLALSALLAVMAGVLLVLDKFKVKFNGGAVAAMALLGLVMAELAGVMILANLIDADGAITRVQALATLVTVLTFLLIPLTLVGGFAAPAFIGIGALATIAASLVILVGILALMDGIENATANAKTLAMLATVLTLLLIPLTLIGALVAPAFIGVGALATLMASLLIVVGILALMEGIDNARANADILIDLLKTLTTTLVLVSLVAPLAVVGVGALGALMALIGKLALFIVAAGALMEYAPDIENFVDNGLELFKKLARGVGELISEFGVGITSGLPEIGENLSKFAEGLDGFLVTMRSVDGDIVTNAGLLMSAISKLTAADFLDGLNNLMSFGKKDDESSLEILGKELSGFAKNASDFITSMDGMKPETATSLESFCTAIEALNRVCGNNNFSDGALSAFGTDIQGFAGSMKSVSESLKDLTDDDVANIKRAAEAGEAIAALNECIPKSGGVWQDIAGEGKLDEWGKKIEAFADSLVNFSIKVSGKSIDKDAIIASADAATSLATLNENIPKTDGVWQSIAGEGKLDEWGKKLVAFADGLIGYSSKVTGQPIDKEAILNSADAASALVDVANALPKEDGTWQKLAGQANMESFGAGLTALGTGLVDYANQASQIDDTKIEAIKNSGTAIDEIVAVVKKIPETGGTADWFGNHDPYGFGKGVGELANAITRYCNAAATVDQADIAAITFTKNAIDAIADVVQNIPAIDNWETTTSLHTAVSNIKGVCMMLNDISTAGYVYTGIDSVKTAITNLKGILTDTSAGDLKDDFASLKTAVGNVKSAAETLVWLNDQTYGGVAVLNAAIDDLAAADVAGVLSTFEGKAGSVETAVKGLVNAMVRALEGAGTTDMTNAMIGIVNKAIATVTDCYPMFDVAGKGWAISIASGISKSVSAVTDAITSLCNTAAAYARAGYSSMASAGSWVATGFANGITSKTWYVQAKAKAMADAAEQAARDALGINSPSKVFKEIGSGIPEGFAMGVGMLGGTVEGSVLSMADMAMKATSKSISRISDLVSSDIDAQPTIRPVLDLSDVESGANAIGSMLDMGSSIGVRTNLGAISSMMNSRSQNGVNADVVAAIDKLNKKMDNIQNASYTINGITYDDGSNITDAVATLVRAARIERRM